MAHVKFSLIGASAALLALGACSTPPAGTPAVQDSQRVQNGAIIGGLLGATVGVLTSDDDILPTVLATAAAGAAVGGVIGHELDKQEAELRNSLDSDIGVVNAGDRLILTFPNDLTFATDSAALSPAIRGDLSTVAGSLQSYPGSSVRITGHTDSDGSAAHNQGLSERRAQAVADSIASGGVPYSRMAIVGAGENAPIASNLTPEGKAQNRRVEIEIIPQ